MGKSSVPSDHVCTLTPSLLGYGGCTRGLLDIEQIRWNISRLGVSLQQREPASDFKEAPDAAKTSAVTPLTSSSLFSEGMSFDVCVLSDSRGAAGVRWTRGIFTRVSAAGHPNTLKTLKY